MKFRRKKLLIHYPLQTTILIYTALVGISVTLMNTVVAVLSGYTATKVSPPFLYGFYFIFILAYFVLILALGLILTNRIAGPLYRMKKHLEAVGRGETLSDISFRKNDYFGEVLAPYNQVIKMLRDLQEEKNGRSKES